MYAVFTILLCREGDGNGCAISCRRWHLHLQMIRVCLNKLDGVRCDVGDVAVGVPVFRAVVDGGGRSSGCGVRIPAQHNHVEANDVHMRGRSPVDAYCKLNSAVSVSKDMEMLEGWPAIALA